MSNDNRRRRDPDDFDPEEFGGPLFGDQPEPESPTGQQRRLSFGSDDTGPLPHWSSPPTGEIPRIDATARDDDDDVDVDVWSTFTTESPVWRDDVEEADRATGVLPAVTPPADRDPSGSVPTSSGRDRSGSIPRTAGRDASGSVPRTSAADRSGELPAVGSGELFGGDFERPYGDESGSVPRTRGGDLSGEVDTVGRRDPARITIGTDPSGMPRRSSDPRNRRGAPGRSGPPTRSGRPVGATRAAPRDQRDLTTASAVGLGLAAVFVVALMTRPVIVAVIVAAILGIGAWEYFGKITEKGYRPSVMIGVAAAVGAPLATYWVGETAIPLVIAIAFIVASLGFVGARGIESGPLPNMAVTTMGVVWIAILGSFAGALLNRWSGSDIATDTLFLVALGVVANDVGALAVGSAVGKTPLRPWISPGKTVEGLLGGTLATFVAIFVASRLVPDQNIWGLETKWPLLLAVVVAVLAPLGDLTESMFKRNLEIKDFGTVVAGHGGVLDRFDAFLFVLPGVYYLLEFMSRSDSLSLAYRAALGG